MQEAYQLPGLLGVGLGLGMLHALDADHIAAVSALSARSPRLRTCLAFSIRWGAGHALMLGLLALAVIYFDLKLPAAFSNLAEQLVAAVLIAIGLLTLLALRGRRLRLSLHRHANRPPHLHWRYADELTAATPHHNHQPLWIGMLHGAAGAAPLLAMLPLALSQRPGLALVYIAVFGLSVTLAMALFGGALGMTLQHLAQRGGRVLRYMQTSLASFSIGMGAWMLFALH